MARNPNLSKPAKVTITLPEQTFAYLTMLATSGALASNEAKIAALIVVNEVERLMVIKRAELRLM